MTNRIIVAGSRTITDKKVVSDTIKESPHNPFFGEIVTGGARGVDTIAKGFAKSFKHVDYKEFPANWESEGKAAGPKRNRRMAEYGDALIAVWDGESSGTRDMIEKALDEGIDVYVRIVDKHA